jgi:hypothetical protein
MLRSAKYGVSKSTRISVMHKSNIMYEPSVTSTSTVAHVVGSLKEVAEQLTLEQIVVQRMTLEQAEPTLTSMSIRPENPVHVPL